MIKILYIISSSKIGGGEMHLLHLLSQMKNDKRFSPEVYCLPSGVLESKIRSFHIPVKTFEMENILSIRDIPGMALAIRQKKPDLIHCHLNRASLYGSLLGKLNKIPVVATAHGLTKTIYYRFASKIICVSEAVKRHFKKNLAAKAEMLVKIHNGIPLTISCDPKKANSFKQQLLQSNDEKLITVIGTYHQNKGQEVAIRALKEIPACNNVKLLLTGAGATRQHLQQLASSLSLTDKVLFLPPQENLSSVYLASDFIIVPSYKEALSLVTLEALLHKRPVIASNTGGIPEIITDNEEGNLVEPGNHRALSAAIVKGFEDYDKACLMAEKGCQKVKNLFSLKLCYDRTTNIYLDCVNNR